MEEGSASNLEVVWKGEFKFRAKGTYGHATTVEAGEDFDGFRPGELLMTRLARYSGMDVGRDRVGVYGKG